MWVPRWAALLAVAALGPHPARAFLAQPPTASTRHPRHLAFRSCSDRRCFAPPSVHRRYAPQAKGHHKNVAYDDAATTVKKRRRLLQGTRRESATRLLSRAGDPEEATTGMTIAESAVSALLATLSAVAFGAGLWVTRGEQSGLEFFAGYLVEQSLSVDNLLVFLVLFDYFNVAPGAMQQKALAYGLYGAVICRAIFVILGYEFIANFRWTLLIFAGILIFASTKLLFFDDINNDDNEEDLASNNAVVKLVARQTLVPATDQFDAVDPTRFFTTTTSTDSGSATLVRRATPLLAAVVCLELSDVVFAVDSVPAVFAVSQDPFVVYSSNLFAIVGLRAWYTVLAAATQELEYLDKAVALVLGFVGGKIAAEFFGYDIDTATSLAIIATTLGGGVVASLLAKNDTRTSSRRPDDVVADEDQDAS